MLFQKKTKGIINAVWTAVVVLVIVSMVLLYAPIFQ